MAVNGSQSQRQLSDDPILAGPGGPSPDGRFLSFVWDGDVAVHDFATGQRRKVTTEDHPPDRYKGEAETSRFSADGASLFYVWYPLPAGSSSDVCGHRQSCVISPLAAAVREYSGARPKAPT